MTSKTWSSGVVIDSAWLQDVDTSVYTTVPANQATNTAAITALQTKTANLPTVSAFAGTMMDDANAAAVRTTIGSAASGANTDITSLSAPALGAATATTQAASDNSTKVATTAYADRAGAGTSKIQSISASVAANALTITLQPTTLDFRSTTLGSGTITTVSNAAAISTVISSGSTAGTTNAVKSGIWVAAINNAGTMELAWTNGTPIDETGIINTTAEGGAGAADSGNVWYSTTARTGVAYRIVGRVDSTQATAGTWATAPSLVQGAGGFAFIGSLIAYTRITATNASLARTVGTTRALYRVKGGGGNGGASNGATSGGGGGEGQERVYFDTAPTATYNVTIGAAASSSSIVGSVTVTATGGTNGGSGGAGAGGGPGARQGGSGGLGKVGADGSAGTGAAGGNNGGVGGGVDGGTGGGAGSAGTAGGANTGCGGQGSDIGGGGGAGAAGGTGVVEIWEYA
jgi:hypothetical protein